MSSNLSYLSEYQPFETTEELNETVAEHLTRNRYDLNETDRDVIVMLSRYAVKYTGVAHLKVATIAKTVDKSARTVQRVLRKLERLNIIERQPFLRKVTGGFGASIFIFVSSVVSEVSPRKEAVKPTQVTDKSEVSENEPIYSINPIQARTRDGEEVDKRGLRSSIPSEIYEVIASYYDSKGVYDVVGVLYRAKASIDRTIRLEDFGDEYIDVFYNVIRKYKLGQVRNFNGLLYVAWERLSAEISRQIHAQY